MIGRRIIYPLLVVSFLVVNVESKEEPEVEVILGVINETVADQVNSAIQKIVYYNFDDVKGEFLEANVRIRVTVSHSSVGCPVLFSVREPKSILSWHLPIEQKDKDGKIKLYFTTERSICNELGDVHLNQKLQVEVSTCSIDPIEYSVSVQVFNDAIIRVGDRPKVVTVSPVAPVYYRYDPLRGVDSVVVSVDDTAGDDICLIFSIQQPNCPVFDQEFNVQFKGNWQTMTAQGSLLLRKKQYPNGFFLVLVALSDDEPCTRLSTIYEPAVRPGAIQNDFRQKTVTITVESVIEPEDYVTPVLIPLVFILGLILFIFIVFSIFQNLLLTLKDKVDETIVYKFRTANSRFQSCLRLEELKETNLKNLQRKSDRYYWSIATIGIFYCVPVIQLISNYLKVLYRTGDNDLCYYNYRCARPLGYIIDFNHIYSNIGYVLFGIAFMLFANFRQRSLSSDSHSTFIDATTGIGEEKVTFHNEGFVRKILPRILANSANDCGTLPNFGIYYALGIALVLEGVLSAAYHICPNQSNFQFDTSFMYVIAVLGIVKIYQFRHPVYVSANITFISLAFVAASSVFGLLFNNLIFKICFSVFYFISMLALQVYLYHMGFTTDINGTLITNWFEIYKGIFHISKTYERRINHSSKFGRILLPVLGTSLNIIIIVLLWTVMIESNFATQLLAIFVANFAVYTMYYCIMKLVHQEYRSKLWIQLLIYGSLSIGLWILSLNYFQRAQTSWEDSPAESRELNDDCIVYSFYDNHDLWHFTSSGALMTSFMMLLTIDDDLITTNHDSIPVF